MDLKQSTASQEILLGPFLDDDDGVTQKTGLTIANTDIQLFKAGATAFANKTSGGATEIANGFYYAVLDATDTDTAGLLVVKLQITDCLCVMHAFNVLAAGEYDAKYGTGTRPADLQTIKTQGVTCGAGVTVGPYVGNGTAALASDANGRVQVQVGTGAGQINSSGGKVPSTLAAGDVTGNLAAAVQTIATDAVSADALNANAVTEIVNAIVTALRGAALTTGSVATDAGNSASSFKVTITGANASDFWKYAGLRFTSGALAGQLRRITAYNNSTGVITCDAFTATPADAVTFVLVN